MSLAHDTIYALSSGRPPAAIAVVRISGPRAGAALQALTGRVPEPRRAALARVRDPQSGEALDAALALFFPAPHSETGEDVAELQLHGGRAVIAGVLAALACVEGLRPAEAGEFTRRAFANGKLDLTEVEGLADLIFAETPAQRRQALRQLQGLLGDRAEAWRARMIEALALIEAGIDFSDEGDVPENLAAPALAIARNLHGVIAAALNESRRGERLREGLVVAIAGPPNAGKSTLLNRIARREAAIVSPYAGTTRDVIEVHLDLDGYPLTLLDTAGIRESDDPVEREGVARARARAAAADLVLWVVEASDTVAKQLTFPLVGEVARRSMSGGGREAGKSHLPASTSTLLPNPSPQVGREKTLTADVNADASRHPEVAAESGPRRMSAPLPFEARPETELAPQRDRAQTWLVRNKVDLVNHGQRPVNGRADGKGEVNAASAARSFAISAATGEGVEPLIGALATYAAEFFGAAEPALVTRERQRRALEEAAGALARALEQPAAGREDIVAEELRLASRALGRLTGRVDVEDILDKIFRDFCIGK
jgi:tRNA modification GTPase